MCNNVQQLVLRLLGQFLRKLPHFKFFNNVTKMPHVYITMTSEMLMLSTSYFQHFIVHHFSMGKYILVFCKSTVLALQGSIPLGVQNCHIFHVEAFKSLQFWCVRRGVLLLLICPVR